MRCNFIQRALFKASFFDTKIYMRLIPDKKLLCQTLKLELKKQEITYKTLAIKLGVSEVSIKRLMSNGQFSLKRLSDICEILNLRLSEVIAKAETINTLTKLKKEQERYLSQNPEAFRIVLGLLSQSSSFEEIKEASKTGVRKLRTLMQELEKQNIIEILPNGKYQCLIRGSIQWKDHPLLMETYFLPLMDYIYQMGKQRYRADKDHSLFRPFSLRLTQKQSDQLIKEVNGVLQKYAEIAHDKKSSRTSVISGNVNLVKIDAIEDFLA